MSSNNGTSASLSSSSGSGSGKKGKRLSIFKVFNSKSDDRARSSSLSTNLSSSTGADEQEDSSEDDRSIDLGSYAVATGPVCFKGLIPGVGKSHASSSDRLINIPEGEDYEKYLKQPKYIKTFKRSGRTLPICKQLFLAQELLQSAEPRLNDLVLNGIDDIELKSNDEFDANSTPISTDTHDETLTNKHAIWAMKFSNDGKYLASAGRDSTIKIWKVISSPLDRLDSPQYGDKTEYASVFQDLPYRSYVGHSDDILSLDWSKNNFLLSSSMDKTVKLWNVNEDHSLRTFVHNDFVPSIKFHPTDDRFFISGCLDHKVRLWSILENEVSYEFDAKNLVTAVAFVPNGSMTIVGTFNGTVYFLDTENLELKHSLDLNKKKGKESSKITGIESFVDGDDVKVLISSNDSRVRLISLRHKQLEFYFKGLDNNSSQIIATVSDSHKYLISGSENHWVYLWEIDKPRDPSSSHLKNLITNKRKRSDYTSFHAHSSVVTCALIAPSGTFKALSLSNDFIYELNCELNAANNEEPQQEQQQAQQHQPQQTQSQQQPQQQEGSLLAESYIGGIIVTSDDRGLIRVFRQDFSTSVRKKLLTEKKKREREPYKHKHLNLSSSSVLSRSNSLRKIAQLDRSGSPPHDSRSRSGTMDYIAKINGNSKSAVSAGVTCDVCGGDKFHVGKSSTGVEMFCSDCGNQIR